MISAHVKLFAQKGRKRPKRIVQIAFAFAFFASFCSCTQTLSVPASPTETVHDFFWQKSDLSSGLDYSIVRNGPPIDHILTSLNEDQIEDGSVQTLAVHSSIDSISIDSMGVNSIFSLPAGYSFGTDSLPGSLLILLNSKLDSGDTWPAGNLIGPGLGQGVPVIGQVLERDDSLLVVPAHPGAMSAFGQSIRIKYLPIIPGDSGSSPIYWIAYYSTGIGPVRIEEYASDSLVDYAQIVSR